MSEKVYEKVHTKSGMVKIEGMGDIIAEARKRCNLSMIKAAIHCGVSENSFFRWEHGATRSIRAENYNKLVDILNGEVCA